MRIRDSSGFSLLEVLIGGAVLVLMAAGFFQFLNGALRGQKTVQAAVDFDILKTNLNLVLNTHACDGAFEVGGSAPILSLPPTMDWSTLTTATPTNVILPGAPLQIQKVKQGNSLVVEINQEMTTGIKISKLEFADAIFDGDQSVVVNPTTVPPTIKQYKAFVANLHVEAQKPGASATNRVYKAKFGVRILVDPTVSASTGAIERCAALATGAGLTCETFLNLINPDTGKPICGGGASVPPFLMPVGPTSAQKFCEEQSYKIGIIQSTQYTGSVPYALYHPSTYYGPGWSIVNCTSRITKALCCK